MPKIYRTMKRDGALPVVANSFYGLGARSPRDIPVDVSSSVHPGTGGMSVNADPFALYPPLIPQRLKDLDPRYAGGTGPDDCSIFCMGEGEFADGRLGGDLDLRLDPGRIGHGFVEPAQEMESDRYLGALAATRGAWQVCEEPDGL